MDLGRDPDRRLVINVLRYIEMGFDTIVIPGTHGCLAAEAVDEWACLSHQAPFICKVSAYQTGIARRQFATQEQLITPN